MKYLLMLITIIVHILMISSIASALNAINSNWNSSNYVMEMTICIKSSNGEILKISKEIPVSNIYDQNYNLHLTPAFWGEEYFNSGINKFVSTANELKEWILEKIRPIFELLYKVAIALGVVLIFLATGIMTYFANISFPILPKHTIFFILYIISCFLWYYLTPLFESIVYSTLILLVPYAIGWTIKQSKWCST